MVCKEFTGWLIMLNELDEKFSRPRTFGGGLRSSPIEHKIIRLEERVKKLEQQIKLLLEDRK